MIGGFFVVILLCSNLRNHADVVIDLGLGYHHLLQLAPGKLWSRA